MQIDRSPSRGPYFAALICLFVLCLIVPVYWQSNDVAERAEPVDVVRTGGELSRIELYSLERIGRRYAGQPAYGPDQSLDELLRDVASRQAQSVRQDDAFTRLLTVPSETHRSQLADLPPYVTAVFRRAGNEIARRPAVDISPLVARFLVKTARPVTPTPRSARLMLTGPSDRLALLMPLSPNTVDVEAFDSPWSLPTVLLDRLQVLAQHPYTADWAERTIEQLRPLTEYPQQNTLDVAARLLQLNTLAMEAVELAEGTRDDAMRAELMRAHWGLTKRITCWALMRDITIASAASNRFAAVPWNSPNAFAGQGVEPVDLQGLSNDLEKYERVRSPQLARAIIRRQQLLAASENTRERELADEIEQNYRNANVRVAITAEMLRRFVPQPAPQISSVHDRIAGTPVRGMSETFTESSVRLSPDDSRWNMDLAAKGMVQSRTVANGGPAQVRTSTTTQFSAEKSIIIEQSGVKVGTATAEAETTCSQLRGVQTNFDWMPIVNDVVRTRAIDQYRAKKPYATGEVEYKVARRVESQLDERAGAAIEQMENDFRTHVTGPLENAGVIWEPVQLSTMEDRVVARLRVAGDDQLAGHTPRPRAPSDSLASLQLHESALTNAARSLGLDGRRFTAPELQALMLEKFSRSPQPDSINVEADTEFDFADLDAVRMRMADGKLEVILSLTEVEFEGEPVRNFRVHAFYRPVIEGIEAEFARDGSLGIEGRLRTGERARMHGVFNKVLGEDRRLPIVRLTNPEDPRLTGLMITQLVLEDGWMGLAIGPRFAERAAERSRTLR